AVSPDESAATRLSAPAKGARPIAMLGQPVWLSLPSATLKKPDAFPTGTRFEAQLDVVCRSEQEASIVAEQFQKVTGLLKKLLEREKQKPGPADLAGVLTAGVFHHENTHMLGRWPLERAFIENLAK